MGLKSYKILMTHYDETLAKWDELTIGERVEVVEFMKRRRTKYGSAEPMTMLIVAFVVAGIGLMVMALVGK